MEKVKIDKIPTAREKELLKIAKGIMTESQDGILLILSKKVISEGTQFEGCCLVHNISREHLVSNVVRSFSLSPLEMLLAVEPKVESI
jgi:hypothetical protein